MDKSYVMKKMLLSLLLAFSAFTIQAQSTKNFEGSIVFSFEISGGGEELEMAKAFMPTGYLFRVKGENVRMTMQGGMMSAMMGDILVIAAKEQTYMVNDASKSAMLMPKEENKQADNADKFDVEEGADARTVVGMPCKHFIVRSKDGELIGEYWVTDAFQVKVPKSKSAGNILTQGSNFGVKGFPLRVVMNQQGMQIVMEAKEVKAEKLSSSLFEVPKGYTVSDFNPAMFQMGGDE